ncbi:MAG: hypothetical protein JW795_23220 [Chitinivibrionales bacterium]|nr:hypothetical protein [Chitinivibrionales bacterium]
MNILRRILSTTSGLIFFCTNRSGDDFADTKLTPEPATFKLFWTNSAKN